MGLLNPRKHILLVVLLFLSAESVLSDVSQTTWQDSIRDHIVEQGSAMVESGRQVCGQRSNNTNPVASLARQLFEKAPDFSLFSSFLETPWTKRTGQFMEEFATLCGGQPTADTSYRICDSSSTKAICHGANDDGRVPAASLSEASLIRLCLSDSDCKGFTKYRDGGDLVPLSAVGAVTANVRRQTFKVVASANGLPTATEILQDGRCSGSSLPATNHRCGTCCGATDTTSALCNGADVFGNIRGTTRAAIELACRGDPTCVGYEQNTEEDSFRPLTQVKTVLGSTGYRTFLYKEVNSTPEQMLTNLVGKMLNVMTVFGDPVPSTDCFLVYPLVGAASMGLISALTYIEFANIQVDESFASATLAMSVIHAFLVFICGESYVCGHTARKLFNIMFPILLSVLILKRSNKTIEKKVKKEQSVSLLELEVTSDPPKDVDDKAEQDDVDQDNEHVAQGSGDENTDNQDTDKQETDNQNTDNQNIDNKNTDNQDTDNQDTDNQDTDNQDTDNQNTDNQNTDNQNAEKEGEKEVSEEQDDKPHVEKVANLFAKKDRPRVPMGPKSVKSLKLDSRPESFVPVFDKVEAQRKEWRKSDARASAINFNKQLVRDAREDSDTEQHNQLVLQVNDLLKDDSIIPLKPKRSVPKVEDEKTVENDTDEEAPAEVINAVVNEPTVLTQKQRQTRFQKFVAVSTFIGFVLSLEMVCGVLPII